ncbi:hypothetical protein [Streptomyces sp. CC210A]|uniref:hypothetical protein n=1 Tax=Streptomyces sp. CC210A TaxID=2898184 RepID=UPI001F3234B6|nr:hypothetical protein [Streptomyces sp. CC210A]
MPYLLTSLPPVAQGIAIAAGGPVLLWSLWSTARLAAAKRKGTDGIDLAAYGLAPRHLLDPSRSGPPEPEAVLAVQAAEGGDRRPAAALLADAGEDWDLRWDRLAALALAAAQDGRWLAEWRAERPEDPDAAAVHAEALLRQAWAGRGGSYARDTSADDLERFRQLLTAAVQAAREAAALAPRDPSPWVTLVSAARGLALPHTEFRQLWDELTARAPHHFFGHLNALQYWCAKWCGSHALAQRFADGAARSAPEGSLLSVLPLQAAFERALARAAYTPLGGRNTPGDLDAVRDAVAAAPSDDPRLPYVRHILAGALVVAGRGREALEQFRAVEPWVGAHPWTCHPDPAAAFDHARAVAVYRSGRWPWLLMGAARPRAKQDR